MRDALGRPLLQAAACPTMAPWWSPAPMSPRWLTERIARLTTERSYMSLMLDVAEVQAATWGPDHGGLTGLQIKERLSTTASSPPP